MAYHFMNSMAKPVLDENGSMIDPGSDINMPGHISEYVKDVILFSVIVQVLSLISSYFWWVLLIAPIYVFYLLWKNFIGPWIFAPAPEESTEKEQKKPKEKIKYLRR